MRKSIMFCVLLTATALPLMFPPGMSLAGDWSWLTCPSCLKGTPLDIHRPEACQQCGHEGCIERVPVQDCVTGEKKVYKPSIHCEYSVVPEVRYRWQMKCITKEIPANYCKPVCETKEVDHCYEAERWDKQPLGCGELECKSCEARNEKLVCKECKTEPGQTTIKVHYWSCVKVPYTVYRQVAKEVCVKQPRCEKVEVPITRYVCQHCEGEGCPLCQGRHCEHCNGQGCEFCKGTGRVDGKAEGGEVSAPLPSNPPATSDGVVPTPAPPQM